MLRAVLASAPRVAHLAGARACTRACTRAIAHGARVFPHTRALDARRAEISALGEETHKEERAQRQAALVSDVLADPLHTRGLARFATRVMARMGVSVGATVALGLAGHALVGPAALAGAVLPIVATSLVGMWGGIYALSAIQPRYVTVEHADGTIEQRTEHDARREAAFCAIIAGAGLCVAPMVSIVATVAPMALPMSLLTSALVFGGAAYATLRYAARRGDAAVMRWRAPLYGGLGALVVTQLAGVVATLVIGPNAFSIAIHSIDTFGGIALFTALSGYDTYMCVRAYALGAPDELVLTTSVYLDFINLWIRIMEVYARARK